MEARFLSDHLALRKSSSNQKGSTSGEARSSEAGSVDGLEGNKFQPEGKLYPDDQLSKDLVVLKNCCVRNTAERQT